MPKVTIFNSNKDGVYDVRIKSHSRKNGYTKLYHMNNGIVKLYPKGTFPEKRENSMDIPWENLSLSIRKFHFKQIFPNGTSHKEYINYIYGKDAKAILDFENWLNSQHYFPISVAWEIYKRIGMYERPKLLQSSKHVKVYLLNNEYFVTLQKETQRYTLETREEYNKSSSSRIQNLSERMDMPKDIVSIVKLIKDDNTAINALKKLKELRYNRKIIEKFEKFDYYNHRNLLQAAKNEANGIKKDLEKIFGKKTYTQMNLSISKFTKLAYYLLDNS